ncbi:alpha-ketoglutarate-dependent dioxygenase AlkB (plasmid) [Paraburkholderia sp. PGU19]|nr:alpha-ketoglutarate-dependent dioxygenase AlkB [Paraburkholderia sp. PGU19]BCG05526.1 alpha-ketoglutarate-dependent dioxygenase AlkB [Paraburkholderia sp. PGU19]
MHQQGLFGATPLSLINDDEGGIRYLPSALSPHVAQRWFAQALENVHWTTQRRMMYDREVAVPRLLAAFPDSREAMPEPLSEAFDFIRALVGAPFNRVGLDLYRDGNDSVAPHGDKTMQLTPKQPIAILSLGAPRRMSTRPKVGPGRTINVELQPGSCLLMSYASQLTHEHGIPKSDAIAGPRISFAFRCFEFG